MCFIIVINYGVIKIDTPKRFINLNFFIYLNIIDILFKRGQMIHQYSSTKSPHSLGKIPSYIRRLNWEK